MIYLDNSATTAPCPEAIAAAQAQMEHWGNPSALHRLGVEAREALEAARANVAAALGAEKRSIVFTSGGTEADNLAIFGAA
ncbi:MAG: aminotransferase class V-fold PLP-dependent enzyme, partial [Oscillospiraceae bacterium]|nr:aminotransferase class V-fold PLP-dependent enzyme [Oscillospiraceae bacterium]